MKIYEDYFRDLEIKDEDINQMELDCESDNSLKSVLEDAKKYKYSLIIENDYKVLNGGVFFFYWKKRKPMFRIIAYRINELFDFYGIEHSSVYVLTDSYDENAQEQEEYYLDNAIVTEESNFTKIDYPTPVNKHQAHNGDIVVLFNMPENNTPKFTIQLMWRFMRIIYGSPYKYYYENIRLAKGYLFPYFNMTEYSTAFKRDEFKRFFKDINDLFKYASARYFLIKVLNMLCDKEVADNFDTKNTDFFKKK